MHLSSKTAIAAATMLGIAVVCTQDFVTGHEGDHAGTPHPSPAAGHRVAAGPAVSHDQLLTSLVAATRRWDRTGSVEKQVRLVQRQPASSEAWTTLGNLAMHCFREGSDVDLYPLVESVFQQARALDRTNADALAGLAWAAGAAHRFEDSVAWAQLALKEDPELTSAHGVLADAYVELGDYDAASTHVQRMLDLKPDAGAYSRAAKLMYVQGNPTKAHSLLELAIDATPPRTEARAWCIAELALMKCREGDPSTAINLLESELRVAPANLQLLHAAGYAYICLGDQRAARGVYERAAEISPQHTSLSALYDLAVSEGRTSDSERLADQLIALHQTWRAKGMHGGEGLLARFYADRGVNAREAIELARHEYEHHRSPTGADTLAWALFRAGAVPEAAALLPEILRLRPSDPTLLYHCAEIEAARGNPATAALYLQELMRRQPRFHPIQANHAAALLKSVTATTARLAASSGVSSRVKPAEHLQR